MDLTTILIQITLMLVMVTLSAFFSGSETALFSLSRARLLEYRRRKEKIPRAIVSLLDDYQHTLIALVLGNMFVNIAISIINNQLIKAVGFSPAMTVILSIFIAVVLLLIFGEVTPKTVALVKSEAISNWVALPLFYFRWLIYPLIFLADRLFSLILNLLGRRQNHPLSHDEYASYIELAASGGAFSDAEQKLLNQALELRDKSVAEFLTPRVDIHTVAEQLSAQEVKEKIISCRQPFIPIVKQDIDDTDFFLSSKEFFWLTAAERRNWTQAQCRFPAVFLPLQASLVQALRAMREARVPALLIVDEFGRTVGMISAKTIYSDMIGQFNYGYEERPRPPERLDAKRWRIPGNSPLFLFSELTGQELPEDIDANTFSGMFAELLGRIPTAADYIELDGITLRAEEVEQHRVKELVLEVTK